jgi:Cu+-exporting ATPase
MTCASSAFLLKSTLKRDPRISSASVNFASEVTTVTGRLARNDGANIISYKPNTMDTLTQRGNKIRLGRKTPSFIAINGKIVALFGIANSPRGNAKPALHALNKLNIDTLMVTGDTLETANYIAAQVSIKTVISHATPREKLETIQRLQAEGAKVGMIGDGINDAPALAAANVGFAIGHGTDIAIESADLTLVNGDIAKVAETIELSTLTMNIIKQNLFWAFGYNTVAIPVAAVGKLSPMIASLGNGLKLGFGYRKFVTY